MTDETRIIRDFAASETICTLRRASGMDFGSYVEHVFKNEQTAITWRNRQSRMVAIYVLPGRLKVGERIEHGTRRESLESRYTTQSA